MPALYQQLKLITDTKVWLCPAQLQKMLDYKNTYIWATTTTSGKNAANYRSRQRGRAEDRDLFYVYDNYANEPFRTGARRGTESLTVLNSALWFFPHRYRGRNIVGIAGGKEKCEYIVKELGFDAAIDHRSPDMAAKLKEACPKGIDVYFENVGGAVWDAVFPLLNDFARVPVCGIVAHYNDTSLPPGPDRTPALMGAVLRKRLALRGFIVWDFAAQAPDFYRDMSQWLREGKIKHREDVVDGIEKAPEAFMGMLKGKNFGKQLVRVAR